MRRLAAAAALAALALTGSAQADTWVVVQNNASSPSLAPAPAAPAPVALPSADVPSLFGALPLGWESPPLAPEQLNYGQLLGIWQGAGAAYGIRWQVLAAINKVESNFGRNMGPSSAGAIGWMQFMPDTWLRWGTDANGDGVADPWNASDAIYSAARYLAAAGGAQDIARAVFAYNHADWYVNEVLQLAGLFGDAGVDATFTLDRLQGSIDDAQEALATANEALVAAQADERTAARLRDVLTLRADRATLISTRLDLERRATLADVAAGEAHARAERSQHDVDAAQATLAQLRAEARPASFAPAAGTLLGAPAFQGGYVFPVGGGPSTVSASHTHHDYPAVDIAAPQGAPAYALTDAVVERVWRTVDPRCGLGMTLDAADGLVWTYCHLSYIDPAVQPGAALRAGQPVGLVGSTGDASGPHLHLQLHPATQWPQEMAWFQGFAGTAFRWQDADPAPPAAGPVFAIVAR